MGALARTLLRIEIPPGQFCPNHLGARGLHPSSALARTLWRINSGKSKHPWAILPESPKGSGATIGDLIPGYPMRWN